MTGWPCYHPIPPPGSLPPTSSSASEPERHPKWAMSPTALAAWSGVVMARCGDGHPISDVHALLLSLDGLKEREMTGVPASACALPVLSKTLHFYCPVPHLSFRPEPALAPGWTGLDPGFSWAHTSRCRFPPFFTLHLCDPA